MFTLPIVEESLQLLSTFLSKDHMLLFTFVSNDEIKYSDPSVIRPYHLPKNGGRIREVALVRGKVDTFKTAAAKDVSHIREVGVCRD